MEITVPNFVTYIIAWLTTLGGIWVLFNAAESVLNKKVLRKLSKWLRNDQTYNGREWPKLFISLFDKAFGRKHFSWRCFFRSALVSIITFFILTRAIDFPKEVHPSTTSINKWWWALITIPLLNTLPDYFSLLQTRVILKWISHKNYHIQGIAIILDFILTFLISFLAILIFLTILTASINEVTLNESSFEASVSLVKRALIDFSPNHRGFLPFIFSTFLTSAWLWLFFAGSLLIKLLTRKLIKLHKLKSIFDLKNKPLSSLGYVCMILVTFLFLILPFV